MKGNRIGKMNFVLYLLTAIKNNGKHPEYKPYPHENDIDEVNLTNNMYNTDFPEINDWWLSGLYRDFLKEVVVSKEGKEPSEKLTEEEFESLKKRLAKNCPKKKVCQCSIDKGDCRLLNGWKKEGFIYKPSYKILGEYLPDEKKVVLYVKNIDDVCGKPTYEGVLPTYIHELFHAYFHDVTEKKNAKYNKIREIEEAMAEFSTLVFIREMKDRGDNKYYWCMISNWAIDRIGEKQDCVGDLPAYGFGRYLFDNIPENEAFDWINKYAERLGYIDEEDELVKQYKQMVCPYYPTEPDQCLELLRKILFETRNQPMRSREDKESDDGMDGLVLVDYTPPYDSFCWKGEIHIKYDLYTDDFNYCNGFMGSWNLSDKDIARIKAFLKDRNNLRDFFDDRKAYGAPEVIKTEHDRTYTLRIKWKENDKTIKVGFGSTIPFKLPF